MSQKTSINLGLKIQDDDEFCSILTTAENFEKVDEAIGEDRTKLAEIESPSFTQATSLTNINSKETLSTIFGKIKKAIETLINHSTDGSAHDTATEEKAGFLSAENCEKLNGIEEGAQVNSVTGVKGSKNTEYRTGAVSLSAEDIGVGAVSTIPTVTGSSGNELDGVVIDLGGAYIFTGQVKVKKDNYAVVEAFLISNYKVESVNGTCDLVLPSKAKLVYSEILINQLGDLVLRLGVTTDTGIPCPGEEIRFTLIAKKKV